MDASQQSGPHSNAGASSAHTSLLIIGAGPFGLAMAAQAQALDIEHVVVGQPMSFWKDHMPTGMILRSGCEWHLDPEERDTLERFAETRGQTSRDVEPLTLAFYLEYADWFQQVKRIQPTAEHVRRLDHIDGRFAATLGDETILTADRVLLALGFASFAHIPEELATLVPAARCSHTCDCVALDEFSGRRVLIVGGRQSAFESAALIAEAGAEAVHVCHRHETPAFTHSDWSWVAPLLERIAEEPGWYRRLAVADRQALDRRFWEEGRLKLEPWLGPRVHRPEVTIHPQTRLVDCEVSESELRIRLDNGASITVDHVLFATGYRVDLRRVPLLNAGNLLQRIQTRDGSPVLDESMQTTVPGLFVTSLPAARDFGLFFAFTAAVRASARIIGRQLATH